MLKIDRVGEIVRGQLGIKGRGLGYLWSNLHFEPLEADHCLRLQRLEEETGPELSPGLR